MITIIACLARNRVIGRNGRLPWRFRADLKHFKRVTTGKVVIMGRSTFEETGPLQGRDLVVLSKDRAGKESDRIWWAPSMDTALSLSLDRDAFVAGGAQVYSQFIPLADRMMLTYIHTDVEGDTYFPYFEAEEWNVKDARRGNKHSYIELQRRHNA